MLLFIISIACFYPSNKLDEDNGLEIYKMGTPFEIYKDLNIEIEEGNTKLYSCDNTSVKIAGIEFEYIRVTFCKNKLCAISLATKNSSGNKFFQYLQKNYGQPKKTKENYEWMGNKIQLTYEFNGSDKDGIVSFYSRENYERKK